MNEQILQSIQDGHGEMSMAELAELRKALEIGTSQPVTGTGPDALRVESLESTLKLLTYAAIHVRLWNQIPKMDAFSTVEEYNRLVEYGSNAGGFVPSGDLPEEEDTTYERADQKVKYIGSTRSVHHPATLVRTIPADLISQETQNGALWIMKKVNRALYYGDSDGIPLEFNGITKQVEDGGSTIIDAEGAVLSQDDIENAAQQIIDNFGVPSRMFSNPKVFTDFSKLFQSFQRFNMPANAGGMVGTPATGMRTLSGDIVFEPDTFVERGSVPPTAATSNKAPNAPTITAVNGGAETGSKFLAGDAGDFLYQVTAVNRFGESVGSNTPAAVTIAAGESTDVVITDGGGTNGATAYKLYMSEVDGTTLFYTGKLIARAKTGGVFTSPTTFIEKFLDRPRTFLALLLDVTNQSLTFKQLAPMMKMNLAVISPAIRWMQLLYGTPIVYAPKKNVIIKNIGVAS